MSYKVYASAKYVDEKIETDILKVKSEANAYTDEKISSINVTEQKQIDWNQNDENAIDYVKNRTHWVENGYTIIMPEQSVSNINNNKIDVTDTTISGVFNITVVVDGVTYNNCESWHDSASDICFGNSRLHYDDRDTEINPIDVPFLICYYSDIPPIGGGLSGERWIYEFTFADNNSHIVEVKQPSDNVEYHPLDDKFIPDTIARVEDMNTSINDAKAYTDDKIANIVIPESGVQSISEGSTNGTISVDGTDVAVKGLGSAAYTNSSAYDAAGAASAVDAKLNNYLLSSRSIAAAYKNGFINDALNVSLNDPDAEINKPYLVVRDIAVNCPNDFYFGIREVLWYSDSNVIVKLTGLATDTNNTRVWTNTYWNGTWRGWTSGATSNDLANYLPLSGGTVTGKLHLYGSVYSNIENSPFNGAIEVREADSVGNTKNSVEYAPKIGFHWAQRSASALALHPNSYFYRHAQNANYYKIIDSSCFSVSGTKLTINLD